MSVMVDIRSVHESFGSLEVLKGVDLAVRTGEVTVILGRSCSGPDLVGEVLDVEQGPPAGVLDAPRHERTRSFLSKVL